MIYPEVSKKLMEDKIRSIQESGAEVVVMAETGCLMNIQGGLEKIQFAHPRNASHPGPGTAGDNRRAGEISMSEILEKIDFRYNSQHVPSRISDTFQVGSAEFIRDRDLTEQEYGVERWQELRQLGHDMRLHAIEHLGEYLEILEAQVEAAGGHVHWARTAEEARRIVVEIARRQDVKKIVKVKSMTSEEINLNPDLEKAGISAVETDLGEFIVQLAGQRPSHITGPALHMTKEEIAQLFNAKLGVEIEPDPEQMTQVAATRLRKEFLSADMGISGGNFLIAETGTLVIVTNEGNGRMCTTLPPLHVAVVGIEKGHPRLAEPGDCALIAAPQCYGTEDDQLCLSDHRY